MSNLRQYRLDRGMSRADLARRAAITRGYVHHLEAGFRRRPSLNVLNALCDALSLTPDERVELILSFAQAQPPAPTAVVADGGAPAGTPDTEQMFQVPALAGAEEAA
jgi:transcriptional regulator with XRE-family HTH domain